MKFSRSRKTRLWFPSKEQLTKLGERLQIAPTSYAFRKEVRDLTFLHRKNVIISKLFRFKNRSIILYNVFRFYGARRQRSETKRWDVYKLRKIISRQFLGNVRINKRAPMMPNNYEDSQSESDESVNKFNGAEEDVSAAIREQLKHLSEGKRSVPLFEKRGVIKLTPIKDASDIANNSGDSVSPIVSSLKSEVTPTKPISSINSNVDSNVSGGALNKSKDLINTLYNRFDCSMNEKTPLKEEASKPTKDFLQRKAIEETADEDPNTNNFIGFTKEEIAALCESLTRPASSTEDNSLSIFGANSMSAESARSASFNWAESTDGLVTSESVPPPLDVPLREMDVNKSRTLAEKREKLRKTATLQNLMIENESTIDREMRRKRPGTSSFKAKHKAIQNVFLQQVPMRIECYRAAMWANTTHGRYFKQKAQFGDDVVQVLVGRGNHSQPVQTTKPEAPKRSCECKGTEFNVDSKRTKSDRKNVRKYKLLTPKIVRNIAAKANCPLKSMKVSHKRSSEDVYLDPDLVPFIMPQIQLEVYPKVGRPLPQIALAYLEKKAPNPIITAEWAEFATSTLMVNGKTVKSQHSFPIPYINNERRILTRRLQKNVKSDASFTNRLEESLKTPISLDGNDDDCAMALLDMINATAISIEGDEFIKEDPSAITNGKEDSNSFKQVEADDVKKKNLLKSNETLKNNKRMMLELKRLNAVTVIQHNSAIDSTSCTNDICRLGCVCDSLACKKKFAHCEIADISTKRLAKEEKDFTAKVFVNESDNTIFVQNQREGLKRAKAVPKRFRDDYTLEREESSGYTSDSSTKTNEEDVSKPIVKSPTKKTVSKEHCVVMLTNQSFAKQMEPFCMFHQLYKCYCNLQSTEGKPFILTGDDISMDDVNLMKVPARRPYYSYDTTESTELSKKSAAASSKATAIASKVAEREASNVKRKKGRPRKFPAVEIKSDLGNKSPDWGNKIPDVKNADMSIRSRSTRIEKRMLKDKIKLFSPIQCPKPSESNQQKSVTQSSSVIAKSLPSLEEAAVIPKTADPKPNTDKGFLPRQEFDENLYNRVDFLVDSVEFPEHAPYISVLKQIIHTTISKLCESQRECNESIKAPSKSVLNCLMYDDVLSAYKANEIEIWLGSTKGYQNLYITEKKLGPPLVKNCAYLNQIRNVAIHKLPIAAIMIRFGLRRAEDGHMCVLMLGQQNYWQMNGFVRSDYKYLYEGMEPDAFVNPQLQFKVKGLYRLLLNGMRSTTFDDSDDVEFVDATTCNGSPLTMYGTQYVDDEYGSSSEDNWLPELESLEAAKTPEISITNESPAARPAVTLVIPNTPGQLPELRLNIPTAFPDNIELFDLSKEGQYMKVFPIPIQEGKRYFMLELENDFSHIYIETWGTFLEYIRVVNAISQAKKVKNTVAITRSDMLPHVYAIPQVYAVPHKKKRLFFGPYDNDQPHKLTLCQQYNEHIMVRQQFEEETSIVTENRTRGCWLYSNNQIMKMNGVNPQPIINLSSPARAISTSPACPVLDSPACPVLDSPDRPLSTSPVQYMPTSMNEPRSTSPDQPTPTLLDVHQQQMPLLKRTHVSDDDNDESTASSNYVAKYDKNEPTKIVIQCAKKSTPIVIDEQDNSIVTIDLDDEIDFVAPTAPPKKKMKRRDSITYPMLRKLLPKETVVLGIDDTINNANIPSVMHCEPPIASASIPSLLTQEKPKIPMKIASRRRTHAFVNSSSTVSQRNDIPALTPLTIHENLKLSMKIGNRRQTHAFVNSTYPCSVAQGDTQSEGTPPMSQVKINSVVSYNRSSETFDIAVHSRNSQAEENIPYPSPDALQVAVTTLMQDVSSIAENSISNGTRTRPLLENCPNTQPATNPNIHRRGNGGESSQSNSGIAVKPMSALMRRNTINNQNTASASDSINLCSDDDDDEDDVVPPNVPQPPTPDTRGMTPGIIVSDVVEIGRVHGCANHNGYVFQMPFSNQQTLKTLNDVNLFMQSYVDEHVFESITPTRWIFYPATDYNLAKYKLHTADTLKDTMIIINNRLIDLDRIVDFEREIPAPIRSRVLQARNALLKKRRERNCEDSDVIVLDDD